MSTRALLLIVLSSAFAITPGLTGAEPGPAGIPDAIRRGKVSLEVRARYEAVNQDALRDARAGTVRTRIGFTTAPVHGLKAVVEGENVFSPEPDAYEDGVPPANGRATVADPEVTELNQAYVALARSGLTASLGRQRWAVDNARFVGDVAWRQDNQTFDAAILEYKGIAKTTLAYAFIDRVNRVFGDELDWHADAHVAHVSTSRWAAGVLSFHAHQSRFRESPANSVATYGASLAGKRALGRGLSLPYRLEAARQGDSGNSPVRFDATYLLLEAAVEHKRWSLGAGRESLGSDNNQGFRTPLATLHAFNGWADVFLQTPGQGLVDTYLKASAAASPTVGLLARVHRFETDAGSHRLGTEFDAQLTWKANAAFTVLAKFASYRGESASPVPTARSDRTKVWLQVTYSR